MTQMTHPDAVVMLLSKVVWAVFGAIGLDTLTNRVEE